MPVDPNKPLEIQKKQYQQMVNHAKPRPPILRNTFWAFIVGGIICAIGQGFLNYFKGLGLSALEAGTASAIVLVFFTALFTGLGVYDEIGQIRRGRDNCTDYRFRQFHGCSGHGSQTRGLVLGVGARLFTIAGPILTFGFTFAWLAAILYYLFT